MRNWSSLSIAVWRLGLTTVVLLGKIKTIFSEIKKKHELVLLGETRTKLHKKTVSGRLLKIIVPVGFIDSSTLNLPNNYFHAGDSGRQVS